MLAAFVRFVSPDNYCIYIEKAVPLHQEKNNAGSAAAEGKRNAGKIIPDKATGKA